MFLKRGNIAIWRRYQKVSGVAIGSFSYLANYKIKCQNGQTSITYMNFTWDDFTFDISMLFKYHVVVKIILESN